MKYRNELKNINKMAYPILLNYLLTSIFEILDKAILGHYSVKSFAVAGIAASIIYAVTGAFGILSAAFHIIAAEEKGRQNNMEFEHTFVTSKILTIIIGLGFFIVCIIGGHWFFAFIYKISGNELKEILSYFYPASFTTLQNMLIFQYSAYLRNHLNTKVTLYSTIISTIINLFFDYALVYGALGLPQLGTAGAAWGSVLGLSAGLLVYQIAYYRKMHKLQISIKVMLLKVFSKASSKKATKIFRLFSTLLGQELLESTIFIMVVSNMVARLGTKEMAIYNLLDVVSSTITLPVYAYATATQTYALQYSAKQYFAKQYFAKQNYATNNKSTVKSYLKAGMILSLLTILIPCGLCGLFPTEIFHWIVTDEVIINSTKPFLWIIFLIVLTKIPYQIYMSFLQGIGKEKFVFLCTAIGTVTASIGVVVLGNLFHLQGIYFVMIVEYLFLAIVYAIISKCKV